MKGKLIKTGDEFLLKDLNGETLAITSGTMEGRMLSLKNCQTIERGYDLDEEISNIVKTIVLDDRGTDIWYGTSMAVGKLCFKKALELLGDKKFDMDDITLAFRSGIEHGLNPKKTNTTEYVQSLQQTEWDVEILEECLDKNCDGVNKKGDCITTGIPKLDEESCLILKKL